MKREALLYDKLSESRVQCRTCLRRCVIPEGKAGWCRTRINEEGNLYTLIYGEVSSLSVNPIEKKPVFHFLPGSRWLSLGSVGCNFRCPGCQNWEIAHWKETGPMGTFYLSPQEQVKMALARGCLGLSWTFNEPTLWFEYTLDSARIAKEAGLFTNYVTNGFITVEAFDLLAPFVDVYRVDIKGFSAITYRKVANTPDFKPLLRTVEKAGREGIHVELVTNIIPGWNDDTRELAALAAWIRDDLGPDTPWHITRFFPHCKLTRVPLTPVSTLERAKEIGMEAGLRYVYIGNVPGHEGENTHCHNCGIILIRRYVFDVLDNRIREGRCPRCNTIIPGRF